ncbi:MAG: TOBE domain-containing protein, partial [Leptolyngbyaceae cyanobacterium CAN_BIN12]|nr:TOBE domain-containing protein [Leptolyngbyaceae cyanobacterium CAN_BIN12]
GKIEGFSANALWLITDNGLKMKAKPSNSGDSLTSGSVVVSVRPEKIRISRSPFEHEANAFEGRLRTVMYLGTHVHYGVELASGDRLTVMQPCLSDDLPGEDTPLYLLWDVNDCLALPMTGQ